MSYISNSHVDRMLKKYLLTHIHAHKPPRLKQTPVITRLQARTPWETCHLRTHNFTEKFNDYIAPWSLPSTLMSRFHVNLKNKMSQLLQLRIKYSCTFSQAIRPNMKNLQRKQPFVSWCGNVKFQIPGDQDPIWVFFLVWRSSSLTWINWPLIHIPSWVWGHSFLS